MKVTNSSIVMASSHSASSYTYSESMTMDARANSDLPGAILELSKESGNNSFLKDMKDFKKQQEQADKAKKSANEMKFMQKYLEDSKKAAESSAKPCEVSDLKLELLKKILELLKNGKLPKDYDKALKQNKGNTLDLRSSAYRSQSVEKAFSLSTMSSSQVAVSGSNVAAGTNGNGTLWTRVTATSGFYDETESTTFASRGIVKTADGREMSFGVELSMSRAFTCEINSLTTEDYICTDPLMINLDTNLASVTDQKFYFDLNSDGKEEKMSFAGKGSGFLALDKNDDGIINDGSELFGTKSGDGFKDLAAYDEDGNGWIDENDSVFAKLKVWTKDEDGNDELMDLKKADVGAIYLGNTNTEFHLNDDMNSTNAVIRKTGVFLKESSGQVGTINHVDLAV